MPKIRHISAFTLIELMLVVAIIGLLAAIAIPKFADLIIRAKEASVKAKLGAIRSAISIYYADTEGAIIIQPDQYLVPRYIDKIPTISIPTVPAHSQDGHLISTVVSDPVCLDWFHAMGPPNLAAWSYSSSSGRLIVNCSHPDSRGSTWSQF